MPEDYDLDDDTPEIDSEPEEDEKPSHLRKQIKAHAKRAEEAEARAAAAERALALRESGLDLDNPQHKFFAENTTATTADEIKAEALRLGFISPPEPEVPDEVVEQHAAGAAIAAGAEAGGAGPDVYDLAKSASTPEELDRILREGGVQFVGH